MGWCSDCCGKIKSTFSWWRHGNVRKRGRGKEMIICCQARFGGRCRYYCTVRTYLHNLAPDSSLFFFPSRSVYLVRHFACSRQKELSGGYTSSLGMDQKRKESFVRVSNRPPSPPPRLSQTGNQSWEGRGGEGSNPKPGRLEPVD